MKKWVIKRNNGDYSALAKKTGISDYLASMLTFRGVVNPGEARKFLKASVDDFYDEMLIKDMKKGVQLIYGGIGAKKKIAIYGDYDADGILSTYMLYTALKNMGAHVIYYIPDREEEGYGMNMESIRTLKDNGCEIILTCDNGISAIEEIKYAGEMGISVVVTDHHEVLLNEQKEEMLPPAHAIINTKQRSCPYPFKDLCGAGIALKFIMALHRIAGFDKMKALKYLEYAALATVCDIVDLVEENRIIVKNGLKMVERTKNPGLKALLEVLGLAGIPLKTYHVGYVIGPCINATGRIDNARVAMDLLLCTDDREATRLALNLRDLNKTRQDMTEEGYGRISCKVTEEGHDKDKVILVYDENVHESLAGIIAGRIREDTNRPVIVLTAGRNSDCAKGSGRSIEAYNMFEELSQCKDLLEKFGGHKMAAGVTVPLDNIDRLRVRLNDNSPLDEDDFLRKITIEKHIYVDDVSMEMACEIDYLEPFGKGNPTPVFADKNLNIKRFDILGANKNTLKLEIHRGRFRINALGFNMVEQFMDMLGMESIPDENLRNVRCDLDLDMVYIPTINEYKGTRSLQLRIIDFRRATP